MALQLPSIPKRYLHCNRTSSGATASVCSNVTVKYTGTLLNNSQFDQTLLAYSHIGGAFILAGKKDYNFIKAEAVLPYIFRQALVMAAR